MPNLRATFAACLAIAGFAPALVLAQQVGRDTAALAPVTVTAGRVTTPLFKTPLAVTQLQKSEWAGKSGYAISDALSLVPGVLAQSRYGSGDVRLTIRGFGSRGAGDRSNSGTSRGVRVLLNGIPETEPDGRTSFDALDLATVSRIEVVRSNASALWGNAAGGVVNFTTVPDFTHDFLSPTLQYGTFGLKRASLGTGMLVGQGKLYATAVSTTFDGWRTNSQGDRMLLDGGVVTPIDKNTDFAAYLTITRNRFNVPGPLTMAQVDADPQQANATYLSRRERRDNVVGRLGLTLDHRFAGDQGISAMLFMTPKYLQRSERGTYRDFNRYHLGGNAVYRTATDFGDGMKGTLSIGTDVAYQDGAILFYGLSAAGTRASNLTDNKREGANNFGLFLNQDVDLGAKWSASLGARYDAITYTYTSKVTPKLNTTKGFTGVTPKIGLNYRFSSTHSLYASIGGGVEVPAGNETDPSSAFGQDTVTNINPLLEPVRSFTYEVGTRQVLALGHGFFKSVTYDAAAFWTNVTNEIVPYRGGRFYFTAGQARRSGAELGATIQAEGGWSLATALTFMSAKYTSYVVDSVHYGKPGKMADYSGKNVVGIPSVLTNATLGWAPQALNGLRVQLGLQHTSDYTVDDANSVNVPAATVFNVGLVSERPWVLGDGKLGLRSSFTVQNATDKRFIGSAFLNPDVVGGVPVAFEPGLPRQFVLSFTLERLH